MYNKTDVKQLVSILKMNQDCLKDYCFNELSKYYKSNNIDNDNGFIFCRGEIPIMLVAHLDTVGDNPPDKILYDKDYIISINSILGGDDRCGVFTIIKLLEKGYKPYVLFAEDEEFGGVGTSKFLKKYQEKLDLKYIIELDRRGEDDCVFYDTGNEKFISYIESFGFKKAFGSFSDISLISPQYDIASANLSVGYYKEHTLHEYIDMKNMYKTYRRVCKMLNNIRRCKYFDMQEINYTKIANEIMPIDNDIYIKEDNLQYQEYYEDMYQEYLDYLNR